VVSVPLSKGLFYQQMNSVATTGIALESWSNQRPRLCSPARWDEATTPLIRSFPRMSKRREADGSLRVVHGASIRRCRPCPLREECQWSGKATKKPRQIRVLLHPLGVGSAPVRLRVIGVVEPIGAPVCNSCATSVSRCAFQKPLRPERLAQPHRRGSSRGPNGRALASPGKSGWHALPVPQEQAPPASPCSAFQKSSPPSSV
jgi:hypothetical protein